MMNKALKYSVFLSLLLSLNLGAMAKGSDGDESHLEFVGSNALVERVDALQLEGHLSVVDECGIVGISVNTYYRKSKR